MSIQELVDGHWRTCLDLLDRSVAIESYSGKEEQQANTLIEFFRRNHVPAFVDPRGSVVALVAPQDCWPEEERSDSTSTHTDSALFREVLGNARRRQVPILAYNAHMDVVEAGIREAWTAPPFRLSRRDGKLYGRGACDTKGALAAMATAILVAAKGAQELPLRRAILGCFVTEEEVSEGLAFKEIIHDQGLRPDLVVLGEPSNLEIARGQRGKAEALIRARGRRAHTAVPEAGDNATYKLARALLAIDTLDRNEVARVGLDPEKILERSTLVATSCYTASLDRGSVPDLAEATVTIRLAQGATFASVMQALRALPDWPSVEMEVTTFYGKSYTGKPTIQVSEHPAWHLPRDHPFLQFMTGVYHDLFDSVPTIKIWPFSTDGVYSAGEAGIPTLGFGPGKEQHAHIVDEFIPEDDLRKALMLYSYCPFAA